jgi:hypothetical protein
MTVIAKIIRISVLINEAYEITDQLIDQMDKMEAHSGMPELRASMRSGVASAALTQRTNYDGF